MEQTTAGNRPPIAINPSGPIQILNQNAVRPGGGVGPRMISISPQMLNRPGQPFVQYTKNYPLSQPQQRQHQQQNTFPRSEEGPFQIMQQYRPPVPSAPSSSASSYYNQNHSSNPTHYVTTTVHQQHRDMNVNSQYSKPLSSCSFGGAMSATSGPGPGAQFQQVVMPQQVQVYQQSQSNNYLKPSSSCRYEGQPQQSTQYNGIRTGYNGAGYSSNSNDNLRLASSNVVYPVNTNNPRCLAPNQPVVINEIRFAGPNGTIMGYHQQASPTIVPSEAGTVTQQNSPTGLGSGHYPSSHHQPLKPSQYIAHNIRNSSPRTYVELQPVVGNQSASLIRPSNFHGGGHMTSATGNNNITSTIVNSSRNIYNSNNGGSNNNYYNSNPTTTSVISGANHPLSSSMSLGNKSGTNYGSGYRFQASSSSAGGELTLQSFLSHPSAPFMCPPSSSSTSSTTGGTGVSGYYNGKESWERPTLGRSNHGFVDQEQYTLSSCQYSDAMGRNNASSKGSSSKSKSNAAKAAAAAAAAAASNDAGVSSGANSSSIIGPGGTPSTKSSIPSSKSSKEKEKKDKSFLSSGYSADDDINDVAAMGGVNLAEESQRILGSTEYVGTQIRSCRDETMIQASPIIGKYKVIAAKFGMEELPSADVSALLSHAVEERLKTMVEKLSVIAEHRMDVIKLDERYEITQDVRGQLRFLEELDKLEKKRHDEQEREMLIKAAKSRSKSEDPEQAKLKAKAKEMQRVALEEMRQRDANLTALQAIGPRKKPKLDTNVGSHGSTMPSPLGAAGASSSLGRPQMPLRPRLKRVNLRDLLFLLEHDKETMRSPFLYRNLLLK